MGHHLPSEGITYAHDVLSTLLEAALRDQRLTGEAIKTMNRVSDSLGDQVRQLPVSVSATVNENLGQAVHTAAEILTERVKNTNVQAQETAHALGRMAKQASLVIFAPALVVTALTMAIWYGITARSISFLEEERAELQQTVEILRTQNGSLDIASCERKDGTSAMCIRVEAQRYGEGYHIPLWRK